MDQPRSPELSDILASLAQRAKGVEDRFAELADVTDAAAEERRARAQAAATEAMTRVNAAATSAKASAAADWRALNANIDRQIQSIQTDIAQRQHERDVKAAEQHAAAANERAAWAIAYAAAAVDMAELAILGADVARREAKKLSAS